MAAVLSWALVAGWPLQGQTPTPAVASSAKATTAVADLLERVGIRPLDPPTPAVDLELDGLGGRSVRLSESQSSSEGQGQFTVLTFFATWCQPCLAEMPTLQTLHDGDTAVQVWAVSLDTSAEPVPYFLRETGVDFPVLWDRDGEAGRVYRAGAIPLSYVVDPKGRIVGMARGARDWSVLVGFFEQLALLLPATDVGSELGWLQPTQPLEAISLPLRLTPPEAEVDLLTEEARPGRTFGMEVAVRWAGDFEEYLLHPPQVSLPDGVEQTGVAATTSSRDGSSVVVYRIDLRSETPGEYALDPVELRYTPIYETEPVSRRLAGPTVIVRRPAWQRALPFVGSALVSTTLATSAVLLWLAHRRRREANRSGVEEDREELRTAIAEVRRLRVDGDGAAAIVRLDGLAERWLEGSEIAADRRELIGWLERCRYGGEQPPAEIYDRWLRRLEKRRRELQSPDEKELRVELGLEGTSPEPNRFE